jgi:hypothetical protein
MRPFDVPFRSGFVDQDKAAWIGPLPMPPPALALAGDVRPILLGAVQPFFSQRSSADRAPPIAR